MADLNALKLQVQNELKTVLPVGAVNSLFGLISTQGYVPLHTHTDDLFFDLGYANGWTAKDLQTTGALYAHPQSAMGTKHVLFSGGTENKNRIVEINRNYQITHDGVGNYAIKTRFDSDGFIDSQAEIFAGKVCYIQHGLDTQKLSGIARVLLDSGDVVHFNLDVTAETNNQVRCCPFDNFPESILTFISQGNQFFPLETPVEILIYEIGDNLPIVFPETKTAAQRRRESEEQDRDGGDSIDYEGLVAMWLKVYDPSANFETNATAIQEASEGYLEEQPTEEQANQIILAIQGSGHPNAASLEAFFRTLMGG